MAGATHSEKLSDWIQLYSIGRVPFLLTSPSHPFLLLLLPLSPSSPLLSPPPLPSLSGALGMPASAERADAHERGGSVTVALTRSPACKIIYIHLAGARGCRRCVFQDSRIEHTGGIRHQHIGGRLLRARTARRARHASPRRSRPRARGARQVKASVSRRRAAMRLTRPSAAALEVCNRAAPRPERDSRATSARRSSKSPCARKPSSDFWPRMYFRGVYFRLVDVKERERER